VSDIDNCLESTEVAVRWRSIGGHTISSFTRWNRNRNVENLRSVVLMGPLLQSIQIEPTYSHHNLRIFLRYYSL
jgi:hypothetical protein